MTRLIVDVSNTLWSAYHSGKDVENGTTVEVDGKPQFVNSAQFTYDAAVDFLCRTMSRYGVKAPDVILVVEGAMSKTLREVEYPQYKKTRGSRHESVYAAFNAALAMLVAELGSAGANVVTQNGVEADDVIAYLVDQLDGEKVIVSNDSDLLCLLDYENTYQYRNGVTVDENPFGPFAWRDIPVYKALVGDDSDNIKGCPGFGDTTFLKMLHRYGPEGVSAIHTMLREMSLGELVEDVPDFKPFQKVLDNREIIQKCFTVATLHPEWVNTKRQPLVVMDVRGDGEVDQRLQPYAGTRVPLNSLDSKNKQTSSDTYAIKTPLVFDIEIVGSSRPVFLLCAKNVNTGEKWSFWGDNRDDVERLREMASSGEYTWISFNGMNFDELLMSALFDGRSIGAIKEMATTIIDSNLNRFATLKAYELEPVDFDHIDLCEVAPGVKISLKAYAGRMHYETLRDMPFEHDEDLNFDQRPILEQYCLNDLGVTERLYRALESDIKLRIEMSKEYGIDLRSKSDAQVAEAIFRKVLNIKPSSAPVPESVTYKLPNFIKTDSAKINDLIAKVTTCEFAINPANGSVIAPEFLKPELQLGFGTYQCGVGGLHSTHDVKRYIEVDDDYELSDFDVASYYPKIILSASLIPNIANGKLVIDTYRAIFNERVEAKRSGNDRKANSLKITLNGFFGKLGSVYSCLYSPDLMLGVTMTGQLNLLCLIHELEKHTGVMVVSANTDGIMVMYPKVKRKEVLAVFSENSNRTDFEYEETPYSKVALKDVNNYIAITEGREAAIISPGDKITLSVAKAGKVKRKGLYASNRPENNKLYLMKNPTFEVSSQLAIDYLLHGIHPRDAISKYNDIRDYLSIRTVNGGAIQPTGVELVDDWVLIEDHGNANNVWARQQHLEQSCDDGRFVKRKSRPAPVESYTGGVNVGRIARWYQSTESKTPIINAKNRSKVPRTDGAKLCMTLPDSMPSDVDYEWYINDALNILETIGVEL